LKVIPVVAFPIPCLSAFGSCLVSSKLRRLLELSILLGLVPPFSKIA
jgi:hypothetical protein